MQVHRSAAEGIAHFVNSLTSTAAIRLRSRLVYDNILEQQTLQHVKFQRSMDYQAGNLLDVVAAKAMKKGYEIRVQQI